MTTDDDSRSPVMGSNPKGAEGTDVDGLRERDTDSDGGSESPSSDGSGDDEADRDDCGGRSGDDGGAASADDRDDDDCGDDGGDDGGGDYDASPPPQGGRGGSGGPVPNTLAMTALAAVLAVLLARFALLWGEYRAELGAAAAAAAERPASSSSSERRERSDRRLSFAPPPGPASPWRGDTDPAGERPRIYEVAPPPDGGTTDLVASPSPSSSRLVTGEMADAFRADGVIAVRGLIPPDLASDLDLASDGLMELEAERGGRKAKAFAGRGSGKQFHTVQMGAVYLDPPSAANASASGGGRAGAEECSVADEVGGGGEETAKTDGSDGSGGDEASTFTSHLSAFRTVALYSAVPKVAAELLGLGGEKEGAGKGKKNETLRMLRDVFLAKDEEEYVCGWHVDDYGFWPASPLSDGINAWIALDDMPVKKGGGFALAVGSHAADWRMDAHRAVGSTLTYPEEGYTDAADMFENRIGGGTCNLAGAAPELNARMEEAKRIYEIERGDVIFTARWIFHRTVPFSRDVVRHQRGRYRGYRGGYEPAPPPPLVHRRYSVRYAPGSARLPRGYGTELSILWDPTNAGRTLDEVSARDGPWYPMSWPDVSKEEMMQLEGLVSEKLPVAEALRKEKLKEMQPYLKEMSMRHSKQM